MPEKKPGSSTPISGSSFKGRKPTVIGSDDIESQLSRESEPIDRAQGLTLQQRMPRSSICRTPSVIPGSGSRAITVRASTLREIAPDYEDAVYAEAYRLLSRVVVDDIASSQVMHWGYSEIQATQHLLNRWLEYMSRGVLVDAGYYCARMLQILREVANSFDEPRSQLFFFVSRHSSWKTLQRAKDEIDELRTKAGEKLRELRVLRLEMEQWLEEYDTVVKRCEVSRVMALYLAQLPDTKQHAHHFVERGRLLKRSLESLLDGEDGRQKNKEVVEGLTRNVEEIFSIHLTQWITQALRVVSETVTPTQGYELRRTLETFIQSLKK